MNHVQIGSYNVINQYITPAREYEAHLMDAVKIEAIHTNLILNISLYCICYMPYKIMYYTAEPMVGVPGSNPSLAPFATHTHNTDPPPYSATFTSPPSTDCTVCPDRGYHDDDL